MKVNQITVAVLFLTGSQAAFAQKASGDTLKRERHIENVTVQGTTRKNTESALLGLQKKSAEVIERIGASQLEKQGVGDVALAVTKATGSQKQEGSSQIFVRGLGDRSNSTTLNGLPIPSNDPAYKNIDLGIIKTDMIDFVGLEKVYNPRIWGDMSGANIDIISKLYTGKPYFRVSFGSSFTTNAIKKDHFYLQNGPNYFGFKTVAKPSASSVVNSGYVFTTSLKNKEIGLPLNSSLSAEFGNSINAGTGKITIFGYTSFENDYNLLQGTFGSTFDNIGSANKDYTGTEYKYTTNTTGLLNLNYRMNSANNINFTSNYIHTTEQKLGEYQGFDRNIYDQTDMSMGYSLKRLATYKVNDLFVNQLKGEHRLSAPLKLIWNAGYSNLTSKRPDRQQNISAYKTAENYYFFPSSAGGGNHRYFDELTENDFTGTVQIEYDLNENAKVTTGYQGRYKKSDFAAVQYNFRPKISLTEGTYYLTPEDYGVFFNESNYLSGAYFDIQTFRGYINSNPSALLPQTFGSKVLNNAGFANLDYKFSDRLTAQIGVRYENLDQKVNYDTAIAPDGSVTKNYSKILPALNMKYVLNESHNIRFSASKTYTTPLLLEIAPFQYEEIDDLSMGNQYVYPSDNYNADLKWEWFPNANEVVSVTAFGKYIRNPISRVTLASSSNEVSFFNVGNSGSVFGAEIEIRKDLFNFNNSRIYTFLNASYLNTNQELNAEKIRKENPGRNANFNVKKDHLQGASDLLANVNIGWEQKWQQNTLNFVLSYSHISSSIYALGSELKGNLVDKSVNMLDAVLKLELQNGLGISFAGKNLLDPYFERVQANTNGDKTVRKYKKGIGSGIGLSYRF